MSAPNFRGGVPGPRGGFLQFSEYGHRSAGTHPTGMHSCSWIESQIASRNSIKCLITCCVQVQTILIWQTIFTRMGTNKPKQKISNISTYSVQKRDRPRFNHKSIFLLKDIFIFYLVATQLSRPLPRPTYILKQLNKSSGFKLGNNLS